MSRQIKSKDNLAYYTATLGFVEVSPGGALHYFKVPFSGHSLNLNQIYFMNRLSFEEKRKTAGIELSIMTAILKSLGPIGKKIIPMIAISLQGLLYTIGVSLLGTNLLGQVLGSVLSAVWPMIQSVTAYYLLYGEDFFKLIKMTVLKLSNYTGVQTESFILVLIILISLKIVLTLILVGFSRSNSLLHDKYMTWISTFRAIHKSQHLFKGFLIFYIIYIVFIFYSEPNYHKIVYKILRPVGIMIIFNYLISKINIKSLFNKLPNSQFKQRIISTIEQLDK